MSNLTILNNSIRQLDNLYSLTDLHRASGSEQKHKPVLFLSNQQTKELILEIESESKVGIPTLAFLLTYTAQSFRIFSLSTESRDRSPERISGGSNDRLMAIFL